MLQPAEHAAEGRFLLSYYRSLREFRDRTHVELNCLMEVNPIQDPVSAGFCQLCCWWCHQSNFLQLHPEHPEGTFEAPQLHPEHPEVGHLRPHTPMLACFLPSHFSWGGCVCKLYLSLICLAPGGPEQNLRGGGGWDGRQLGGGGYLNKYMEEAEMVPLTKHL